MTGKRTGLFLADLCSASRLAKWLKDLRCYDVKYAKKKTISPGSVLDSLKEAACWLTPQSVAQTARGLGISASLRSDKLPEQLKQVITGNRDKDIEQRFFTRCSACNSGIEPVKYKNEIKGPGSGVRALVAEPSFSRAPAARSFNWKGKNAY